jgi:hypothetical protein
MLLEELSTVIEAYALDNASPNRRENNERVNGDYGDDSMEGNPFPSAGKLVQAIAWLARYVDVHRDPTLSLLGSGIVDSLGISAAMALNTRGGDAIVSGGEGGEDAANICIVDLEALMSVSSANGKRKDSNESPVKVTLPVSLQSFKAPFVARTFLEPMMRLLPQAPELSLPLLEKQLAIFASNVLTTEPPSIRPTQTSEFDWEMPIHHVKLFVIIVALWSIQQAYVACSLMHTSGISVKEVTAIRKLFEAYDVDLSGDIPSGDVQYLLQVGGCISDERVPILFHCFLALLLFATWRANDMTLHPFMSMI